MRSYVQTKDNTFDLVADLNLFQTRHVLLSDLYQSVNALFEPDEHAPAQDTVNFHVVSRTNRVFDLAWCLPNWMRRLVRN